MASQDEFSSRMLVHLKGLIGAKYPILLIRPIRCTSKKELHRYFADTQQSADAHDIIHVSTRGRGRLDGCRGSPAPRRKQRRSRLITYNNQILEGAAGGVMAWRLSSSAWARRRCVAPYQCLSHRRLQRRRRHPSPEAPSSISRSKMGGRARLGWLWEARRGGASVIIWRLFFRGASTMRSAFA